MKTVWIIDHYSSEPKHGGISRQYDFALELSRKGYNVVEFLTQIGPKLGTVHMHDTKFGSGKDTHELLGEPQPGITAWDDVIRTLLKTNLYRGVFMFELSGKNPNTVMASYNKIVGEYAAKYENK